MKKLITTRIRVFVKWNCYIHVNWITESGKKFQLFCYFMQSLWFELEMFVPSSTADVHAYENHNKHSMPGKIYYGIRYIFCVDTFHWWKFRTLSEWKLFHVIPCECENCFRIVRKPVRLSARRMAQYHSEWICTIKRIRAKWEFCSDRCKIIQNELETSIWTEKSES